MALFRLIRIPNLFILGLTIYILAVEYIYPALIIQDITPALGIKDLWIVIVIAIFMAAAAYLHNDLQDVHSDAINKSDKPSLNLGKQIGFILYLILVLAPIPFAFSVASEIGRPEYVVLYVAVTVLLYWYNRKLKRMPLIGNVVIAFLCAMAVLLVYLGEWDALLKLKQVNRGAYIQLIGLGSSYAIFAFLSNLAREIVKDIEDLPGDIQAGYNTLPAAIGTENAKYWSLGVVLILLISIVALTVWVRPGWVILMIILFLLIIPLCLIIFYLWKAVETASFGRLSKYIKLYMLLGLTFLMIYKYF